MNVRSESGAKLVVSLQLPRFFLWLLAMPFGIASLVGLHLDSAELSRNPKRASGAIELVFTNTRPATRVPITGWGVSHGGMAPLAQKINDWLEQDRGHQ